MKVGSMVVDKSSAHRTKQIVVPDEPRASYPGKQRGNRQTRPFRVEEVATDREIEQGSRVKSTPTERMNENL